MSARILIVDCVATSRIILRVKLAISQYHVDACQQVDEAREHVAHHKPDLVLIDLSNFHDEGLAFASELKCVHGRQISIIATGEFVRPQDRIRALSAGVDDLLGKPVNEALLQARIRSLLRMRDDEDELRLREDTNQALGFSESAEPFDRGGRIAIVAPDSGMTKRAAALLPPRIADRCCNLTTRAVLRDEGLAEAPDLYVIDARRMVETEIFRIVPELRSRPASRHAAQLVILPQRADQLAAMTLDLGANDVVRHDAGPEEVTFRAEALLRRKRQQDRLRDNLRTGLAAAATDPLTGIYNRRFALPHLGRMIEHARTTGRPLAIMMLDLDHFKDINDRWGHRAGDGVLVEVAARLRDSLRPADLIARIGGEEFLIATPDSSPEQARNVAERLCRVIDARPFATHSVPGGLDVTISVGVAVGGRDPHDAHEVEALIERADAALYAAKTAGRNTVSLSLSVA